jgi:hypothetical protein
MHILFLVKILKEVSTRNKVNRSTMVTNHTTGTYSFVNVIYKKVRIL